MSEEKDYRWCWDRLQFISLRACDSRIKRGICRVLSKEKPLGSYWQEYFEKEYGEINLMCEEVKKKKIFPEKEN